MIFYTFFINKELSVFYNLDLFCKMADQIMDWKSEQLREKVATQM